MFAGTQRGVFAALQEIPARNHTVSQFLAAGFILLGIGFAKQNLKENCKERSQRRVRKGQNTEFDGSFIDQIVLLEAAPSALALPSCSSASRFSKGLTQ
jgi:hypothetical protein